jgi:hypothetical protein
MRNQNVTEASQMKFQSSVVCTIRIPVMFLQRRVATISGLSEMAATAGRKDPGSPSADKEDVRQQPHE